MNPLRASRTAGAFIFGLLALSFSAQATPQPTGEVQYVGEWTPGGLIKGTAPVGTRIQVNGQTIEVDSTGAFAFGFERDAKGSVTLRMDYPDGRRESKTIPLTARAYDIQSITGVAAKYVSPSPEAQAQIKADNALIKQARAQRLETAYFMQEFIWPVTGPISGVYGSQRIFNGEPRRPHMGVDVARPTGTPVVAPADGQVTLASDLYYSGLTVFIDHGHFVSTSYLHLSKMTVKPGDFVKQGQKIGEVGATGRVTGPHLHWGLTWKGVRLDPATLVPPMEPVAQAQ